MKKRASEISDTFKAMKGRSKGSEKMTIGAQDKKKKKNTKTTTSTQSNIFNLDSPELSTKTFKSRDIREFFTNSRSTAKEKKSVIMSSAIDENLDSGMMDNADERPKEHDNPDRGSLL